jgi:hypothetical protein
VIPVCDRLRASLARAYEVSHSGSVVSVAGPVVETVRGGSNSNPEGGWQRYSRLLSRLIHEWNPGVTWTPKDLRNCLSTFAVAQGMHSDL